MIESTFNAGDPGSIPGLGRSPGGGHGNPLQYSCVENSTDREAWWATVHGVVQSKTRLSNWHTYINLKSFPGGLVVESTCQCRRHGKILWRKKRQPIPAFLPGKSHGQRCLADYSPWGPKKSDVTQWLSMSTRIESYFLIILNIFYFACDSNPLLC